MWCADVQAGSKCDGELDGEVQRNNVVIPGGMWNDRNGMDNVERNLSAPLNMLSGYEIHGYEFTVTKFTVNPI